MNIGILEWTDENSKGDYPLLNGFGVKAVIVDANFLQFDNSIPVLNTIKVDPTKVTLNITFDRTNKDIVIPNTPFTDTTLIRIFEINTTRYMGSLTIGQGLFKLFEDKVGTTIEVNSPFAATTVVSVNRKSGVFTLQGAVEDVLIDSTTTDGDTPIFFGIDGDTVIWNAVGIPPVPPTSFIALKTLNGVAPTNNHIRIEDSEIIKILPNINSLTFDLANSILNDNIGPTKNYE